MICKGGSKSDSVKVHVNVLAHSRKRPMVTGMKKTAHSTSRVTLKQRNRIVGKRRLEFLIPAKMGDSVRGLDVRGFCDSYQMTQETFTRLTGFSPRAVAHWA